ncbi:hypothetical protein JSO19_03810 [Leucobacter sp. UCMA 4100]|nr:hypothetical protein [Leucobacter sp. UCMA 4100]
MGSTGSTGFTGSTGATGSTGSKGSTGSTGSTGSVGSSIINACRNTGSCTLRRSSMSSGFPSAASVSSVPSLNSTIPSSVSSVMPSASASSQSATNAFSRSISGVCSAAFAIAPPPNVNPRVTAPLTAIFLNITFLSFLQLRHQK